MNSLIEREIKFVFSRLSKEEEREILKNDLEAKVNFLI
jgi:hypothetical protein